MADKPDQNKTLTPINWMAAAAEVLLEKGIDEVKVDRLAKRFGVTRGSFYWHFKSRNDLLDRILKEWTQAHQTFLEMWRSEAEGAPEERLWKIMRLWVLRDEDLFLPQWHAALRTWSKKSTKVLRLYRRQEEEEFRAMVEVFRELGFEPDEAISRAHITRLFFESEGFYVGGTGAPPEERLKYARKLFRLLISPSGPAAATETEAAGRSTPGPSPADKSEKAKPAKSRARATQTGRPVRAGGAPPAGASLSRSSDSKEHRSRSAPSPRRSPEHEAAQSNAEAGESSATKD